MPQATPEQIESWKQQYGDIFEIHVEGKYGYLKKPDRKTVGYAASVQSNPIKSNEIILKSCWIAGDDCIKDDDQYFLSVQGMLAPLMEAKQAEIKKL